MKAYILDASVAVKWYLPPEGEKHFCEARELARQYETGSSMMFAPDLIWVRGGQRIVESSQVPPDVGRFGA